MSLATRIRQLAAHAPRPDQVVPSAVELFRAVAGEPDAWQRDVLTSAAPRILMNCCRQSGKSTVAAVLAVHHALAVPGSLTIMVSPTQRQSGELLRKAVEAYRAAGRPVPSDAETVLRLELASGSRILSLPGRDDAAIRGFSSVGLILADEGARISDQLMAAIRPMAAVSQGRLVGLSTPWGCRGWFWKEWTAGGDAWERYRIDAYACPRIAPEFLEQERRSLGPLWFDSEYLCAFSDTDDMAFSSSDIDAALDHSVTPLWGVA